MFPIAGISLLLLVRLCVAFSLAPSLVTQHPVCQNATKASCWANVRCDDWLERWNGSCPGSPSCTCDTSKAWSDCVLDQYQTTIGNSNTSVSCVDLGRPESCYHPIRNEAELNGNQLAIAYESTAIKNLYDLMHACYKVVTATPAPPAILDTLSDHINDSIQPNGNQTKIKIASFLSSLLLQDHTNQKLFSDLKNVVHQVVGESQIVDVGSTSIMSFQTTLGQALNKTLNAILSDWNTPYFATLANDGALLSDHQSDIKVPLDRSLDRYPSQMPFHSTNFTLTTSSTRNMLSTPDSTQIWDYGILSCDASEPNGLATHLISLLDTFHQNLFQVMLATSKGARSPLGFFQIFKTNQWIPIRRLYEYMHNAVGTAGNLASSPVLPDNRPIFICLQPHKRETRAAYAVCAEQPRLRAFQQPGTPYAIGLCPSFWALPVGPVRAFCPWKGEVSDDYTGEALLLNQQSILVSMLVRIYMGASVLEPERIGLRDVLTLEKEEAYWNPSTWAYWFASAIGCSPMSWNDPDL